MNLWPVSLAKARQAQDLLGKRVKVSFLKRKIFSLGGCDCSYYSDFIIGTMVVYSFPELEVLEEKSLKMKVRFPYVPGLLAFREGPVLYSLFYKLKIKPDILVFDGQGIAHPRGTGIASHLGVLLGIPAVGCAKSRLYGIYTEPGVKKGNFTYLLDPRGERKIGVVLRSRDRTRPLFVSPGHMVSVDEASGIVLSCCKNFRIPEPLRQAHHLAQKLIPK